MKIGREIAVFAGIALVVVLMQAAVLGGFELLARPLWFDECLTWMLATDSSFAHEIRALRGGADTNMPGVYVMLRGVKWFGLLSVEGMRWFALMSTVAALAATFAALRAAARREVAAAGALMVWAHPVVMAHAFEARFYGPMLAGCAITAAGMMWRSKSVLGAGAVLLCGVHYFGAIVLMLMAAGAIASRGWRWREVWPCVFGLAVTIACSPLYFGQRASFVATDWMEAVSATSVVGFAREIVPVAVVVVIALVGLLSRSRSPHPNPLPEYRERGKELALMMALLAMPVVLVVISLVWQPVLMGRYAIVVALGLAAVGALGMNRTPRWVAVAAGVVLFGASCFEMVRLKNFQSTSSARLAVIVDGIEQSGEDLVVFESGFDALPVWVNVPQMRDRIGVIDNRLDGSESSRKAQVVRGQMRNIGRFYDGPRMLAVSDVLGRPRFGYVTWEDVLLETLPPHYGSHPVTTFRNGGVQVNPFVHVVSRSW